MISVPDVDPAGALGRLAGFRAEFYRCLTARADALFELADAVLCGDTPVRSLAELSFRKTVATLLDKEVDADRAAAQLGHGSKEITKKHYIDKPALAPDSSEILEQLGAGEATTGHKPQDHGPRRAA